MRVFAVGAHPDDLELLCAGTLAKCAARGDSVAMAIMTNGELGSSTLSKSDTATVRSREAIRRKLLKIHSTQFLIGARA
jgi:LmbE family N-acetylglucosaminyl deacetylase